MLNVSGTRRDHLTTLFVSGIPMPKNTSLLSVWSIYISDSEVKLYISRILQDRFIHCSSNFKE